MFGIIVKSRTAASLAAAGLLASALLAPAAFAASAGNSFELPPFEHSHAYYSAPQEIRTPTVRHGVTPTARHSTDPNCVGGYSWSPSVANGVTLPMPCRG
jgi:hypothetical protein